MKIIYEAKDGSRFTSESECVKYEECIGKATIEEINNLWLDDNSDTVGQFIFNNIDQLNIMING